MKIINYAIALLALLNFLPGAASATLTVNSLFSDNMVLQRDKPLPVWGTATPGQEITVLFDGQEAKTTADEGGKWRVTLEPNSAGGPFEMTITGANETTALQNVMVGEVWICSGQSNMALSLVGNFEIDNATAEIASASNFPNLRFFHLDKKASYAKKPIDNAKGSWQVCSPEAVGTFSAAGYFFGRELQQTVLQGIPIGLIDNSVGATRAETWLRKATLEKHFEMSELRKAPFGNPISGCYKGMIHPLIPFAMRGVIWYQGESNVARPIQYQKLFPLVINEYREQWSDPTMPFLFVQLAGYEPTFDQSDNDFTQLREAQLLTWLKVPHTGMAVALDLGEQNELHPPNKQDVGHRLALIARSQVYGEELVYSGPLYDGMTIDGSAIRLEFKHLGSGLLDKNGEALLGFEIAGEDGVFQNGTATIEGDYVVVSSQDVTKPTQVRYAWDGYPDADLYNQEGLPATPFRTNQPNIWSMFQCR